MVLSAYFESSQKGPRKTSNDVCELQVSGFKEYPLFMLPIQPNATLTDVTDESTEEARIIIAWPIRKNIVLIVIFSLFKY